MNLYVAHVKPCFPPRARLPFNRALTSSLLAGTLLTGTWSIFMSAETAEASPMRQTLAGTGYAGTVKVGKCSGSLIRLPNSAADEAALVLSNGHCLESGMPRPGDVVVGQPSERVFELLDIEGTTIGLLHARKISYATMTDTDIALYQLDSSYVEIKKRYGINPLSLSSLPPSKGSSIKVVSSYWRRTYTCNIESFAYKLHEAEWTWTNSITYTASCNTIGGTSGSPVLDRMTSEIVGVNNTSNRDGARCTLNNPCEVDRNGTVAARQGTGYGQSTYPLTRCVATGNEIDLTLPGCELPRPAAAAVVRGRYSG